MTSERDRDERIMAYADGELDAAEARAVEALLARDPEARARLRLYLETAALARAAFADTLTEPVPERLVRAATGAGARIPPFPRRIRPRPLAAAIAAGLAALLLVGGWWTLHPDPAARLARVLGTVPSGTEAEGIRPLLTVVTADGRLCRRYRLEAEGGEGLACRGADGDWRVVLWYGDPAPATYAPAGGDARGPMEALLARLGARVLDPGEERRRLGGD